MYQCKTCNIKKEEDCFYKRTTGKINKECKSCFIKRTSINKKIRMKMVGSRDWFRRRYYHLIDKAKKRNIPFDLEFDDFIKIHSVNSCYYCDKIPDIKTIDRKNNLVGYNIQNCFMACMKCNRLKGTMVISDKERIINILNKL